MLSVEAIPGQEFLEDAVHKESHDYVQRNAAPYYQAICQSIARGATPTQIGQFFRSKLPPERSGLAIRCEQAAHWEMKLQVDDHFVTDKTSLENITVTARVPRRD